jgi:hypothetical protein
MCYYNAYAGRPLVHWHWQAVFFIFITRLHQILRYDKIGGGGEFMEKTGRKRIYDGNETERHKQAMKVYVGKKKQEAEAMGVPLRRVLAGGKRQLNVNIETYLYNKLKDEAKRKNKTLRDLVIEKLSR